MMDVIMTATRRVALVGVLAGLLLSGPAAAQRPRETTGPLRVHSKNPRYFTDQGGKAIYLTGEHSSNSLLDIGPTDPPPAFDFNAYLDLLDRYHHNFIRLWRQELVLWHGSVAGGNAGLTYYTAPHPW